MRGLKKFLDSDTGESELEIYSNDSGYIVVCIASSDGDYRSTILTNIQAMELRDHLSALLAIQMIVGEEDL